MKTSRWTRFPHDSDPFTYAGKRLIDSWSELHRGDQEPLPEDEDLLEAWRRYHAGDFAGAVELASEIGIAAHAVANKGSGIYADYLEEHDDIRLAIYRAGIEHAEEAIEYYPGDANAHYFRAFLLGRYSQCISVPKALAEGVGGKIKASLERALELAPEHAEAHTAMGMYHAEIIDKVGRMIGGMTYGASTDKGMEQLERAIELTPDAPIAHIEYGNGLYLLYGDHRLEDSNAAYRKAASIEPIDAMQKLDVEYARASV